MKVIGDSATCADCGLQPTGRWQLADAYLIWACGVEHADNIKQGIWTGGIK
jgi:hypothetical protein